MSLLPFLPDSNSLALRQVLIDGDRLTLLARSNTPTVSCPQCGGISRRVHSRYTRMLADLPWQGRQVCIQLEVRRFFCVTADCPKTTFAERLPQIAAVYARSTTRLHQALCLIGCALGGQAGARLATPLGMPTSPDTLLRRVKASHHSLPVSVRVLGVDDWAWKKGQRYGTILCDLERRRVIDLLPVRSTVSFSSWLKSHPEVEIISRDRGEEYTKGAALGAPQAVQVADRFHLLVNVREALTRVVDRHHTHVSEAAKAMATRRESQDSTRPIEAAGSAAPPPPPQRLSRASQQSLQRRARRLERYQRVLELHQQGVPLRAIARREGMHRGTVRHWIRVGAFPERTQRRRRSRADEYLEYLKRRWDEGCRNARQLTDELRELGYGGSYHTVRRRVGRWRAGDPPRASSTQRESFWKRPSSRRVSWWLLKEDGDLKHEERAFLQALWARCPELKLATELAREFTAMVRQRRLSTWESWLAKVQDRGAPRELRGFADGLKQDELAVQAALALKWSNGQVEGQINKLKLLKRQMFGRAGFELLRSRFLKAA